MYSFYVIFLCGMGCVCGGVVVFFFFKQKTAYEMRISDWSSDVCSSDLASLLQLIAGGCRNRHPDVVDGFGPLLSGHHDVFVRGFEIGRASCRERVCQYV